jgi:putative ATPase
VPKPAEPPSNALFVFSEDEAGAPLAARMRPRELADFVGQPHLVGESGALTKVVQPGYLPSILLWGPPGSG